MINIITHIPNSVDVTCDAFLLENIISDMDVYGYVYNFTMFDLDVIVRNNYTQFIRYDVIYNMENLSS